jgi:glycosyltransferase involved in cell wall biosynthesis
MPTYGFVVVEVRDNKLKMIKDYKLKPSPQFKNVYVVCPIEQAEYAGWHFQASAFAKRNSDAFHFVFLYRHKQILSKISFFQLWSNLIYAVRCWWSIINSPREAIVYFPVFFLPSLIVSLLLPLVRRPYIIRISGGEISRGNPLAYWLRLKMILGADGVIALNQDDKLQLIKIGVSEDRVVRIGNPVSEYFRPPLNDERIHARQSFGIFSNRTVIGVVGTICQRKAQLDLVRAVGTFDRRELVIVLCGPTQGHPEADSNYARICKNIASEFGIEIIWIEFIEDVRSVLWAGTSAKPPHWHGKCSVEAMKQMSLSESGFERKTKRTRKREFLDEMNLVVPWAEAGVADCAARTAARCQGRTPAVCSGHHAAHSLPPAVVQPVRPRHGRGAVRHPDVS